MKRRFVLVLALAILSFGIYRNRSWFVGVVRATTSGWVNSGNNVYFTDGNVGIGAKAPTNNFEISQRPYTPTLAKELTDGVGGFDDLSWLYEVTGSNGYVYLGSTIDNATTIVDVSDPYNPVKKSVISGVGTSYGTYIAKDNYLYTPLIKIYDVSNPTSPSLESYVHDGDGEFNKLGGINDMFLDGDRLFVSSSAESSVTIIDVSDKSDPDLIKEMSYPTYDGVYVTNTLFAEGNYLYVGGLDAVTIYNISNPTSPTKIEQLVDSPSGTYTKLYSPSKIIVKDNVMYVSTVSDDSIVIVDVTDPDNTSKLAEIYDGDGEFNKLNGVRDIDLIGNYLYAVAQDDDALTIIDVSNPSNPELIAEITDGGGITNHLDSPQKVFVDPNTGIVYVTSQGEHTLNIFDNAYAKPLFTVTSANKTGIGTLTPKATLDVNGFMKLKKNTSAPATCNSDTDGAIGLSSVYKTCVCKSGTGWVLTSDGSTSCTW